MLVHRRRQVEARDKRQHAKHAVQRRAVGREKGQHHFEKLSVFFFCRPFRNRVLIVLFLGNFLAEYLMLFHLFVVLRACAENDGRAPRVVDSLPVKVLHSARHLCAG